QIARLAFQGDFDQIRSLATPELVTCKDQNGRTVLMLTADTEFPSPWQSAKCIEYLLHLGADPFETTAGGDTAAHFAARRDNVRLLALLPFDAKWLQNVEGGSPLTEAVRSGSWRCAKHLLHLLRLRDRSSDKKKILNGESKSILSLARKEADLVLLNSSNAMRGDVEEFQRLASCSNCDIPSSTGSTVLMDFVEVCDTGIDPELHASIRQRLIELSDVTAVDVLGNSCLHKAAAGLGSPADCEALIAAGASVNSLNSLHQTPLMLAVRRPQVVEQLLRLGADWTRQNCYGDDALDLADGLGCRETSALLSRSLCSPFLKTWTCIRLLGRGGIGEVHEVETDRGVKCAVKTIKLPMQGGNAQSDLISNIDTIVQGERNLCFLRHRNIVKFIEICYSEPFTVVLFMELLDGQSLIKFINGKPLDELFIQRFTGQICSALSYMHSRKPPVLHRDINCNNIIVLRGDSEIKLIDFGLSVQLNRSVSHVSAYTPTPKGTLYFLAPELLGADESDTVKYSPESDVWAMGCTVYQMVTGTLPHGHCSNMLALANCLSLQGAPKLTRPVSRKLVNFYADCVAQNRRLRKSAAELLRHEFLLNT
uniref:Protein kinase domain-containing protein n=1 Tax=Macrostomum lignano TaxID=282301 RepID=A0A1I8J2J4_9PLAT